LFLGVGLTARLYSIYTPLHAIKSKTSITKVSKSENDKETLLQEGSGQDESVLEESR
jgi:hypothetical protein